MKNKDDKKKNKRAFVDDGRTVYDMSGLNPDGKKNKEPIGLSHKEKFAAIRAALVVFGRIFLIVIGSFSLVAVLMWLWLK